MLIKSDATMLKWYKNADAATKKRNDESIRREWDAKFEAKDGQCYAKDSMVIEAGTTTPK